MTGRRPGRGWRGGRLLCLLWTLAGCTAGPSPEEMVRVAVPQAPTTLDPRYAADAQSVRLCRLLYRPLVDFDGHWRPVPALADWTHPEPRRWRFRLRSDERLLDDGRRLAARDVVATYRALLDPARGSPHRGALGSLRAVEAVDEDVIDFHLSTPDPLFPGRLTHGVLPEAEALGPPLPVHRAPGSGPFRLLGRRADDTVLLARRRDGQRFAIEPLQDPTMRALGLAGGEYDLLVGELPPAMLSWLARRPGVAVLRTPGDGLAYLGFNHRDPALADQRVRRALSLAIDRAAIIRHLYGGAARPAAGLLPPEHWAGHPGLAPLGHDPAEARRLLAEAGHGPAQPLSLVYSTSSHPLRVRLATLLQAQFAAVGVRVQVSALDWAAFYADVNAGRFQLHALQWVGVALPDLHREAFASTAVPPAGLNRGRHADPVFDALLAEAERAEAPEALAAAHRALAERLAATVAFLPLWFEDQVAVAGPRVAGYVLRADGSFDGLEALRSLRP